MFGMNKKAENKVAQDSKSALKKPADAISEEALRGIVGGRGNSYRDRRGSGDVREGISETNANQGYAAGKMNEVDGWE